MLLWYFIIGVLKYCFKPYGWIIQLISEVTQPAPLGGDREQRSDLIVS